MADLAFAAAKAAYQVFLKYKDVKDQLGEFEEDVEDMIEYAQVLWGPVNTLESVLMSEMILPLNFLKKRIAKCSSKCDEIKQLVEKFNTGFKGRMKLLLMSSAAKVSEDMPFVDASVKVFNGSPPQELFKKLTESLQTAVCAVTFSVSTKSLALQMGAIAPKQVVMTERQVVPIENRQHCTPLLISAPPRSYEESLAILMGEDTEDSLAAPTMVKVFEPTRAEVAKLRCRQIFCSSMYGYPKAAILFMRGEVYLVHGEYTRNIAFTVEILKVDPAVFTAPYTTYSAILKAARGCGNYAEIVSNKQHLMRCLMKVHPVIPCVISVLNMPCVGNMNEKIGEDVVEITARYVKVNNKTLLEW